MAGRKFRAMVAHSHAEVFWRPLSKPVTTAKLRRAAIAFDATILVADYVQECAVDSRVLDDATLNAKLVMRDLRTLRDAGHTVFAISSMRQQVGAPTVGKLSYRDSSEIGLMADDCFVLHTEDKVNDDGTRPAELRCDKSRYDAPSVLKLRFDGALQSFEAVGSGCE